MPLKGVWNAVWTRLRKCRWARGVEGANAAATGGHSTQTRRGWVRLTLLCPMHCKTGTSARGVTRKPGAKTTQTPPQRLAPGRHRLLCGACGLWRHIRRRHRLHTALHCTQMSKLCKTPPCGAAQGPGKPAGRRSAHTTTPDAFGGLFRLRTAASTAETPHSRVTDTFPHMRHTKNQEMHRTAHRMPQFTHCALTRRGARWVKKAGVEIKTMRRSVQDCG